MIYMTSELRKKLAIITKGIETEAAGFLIGEVTPKSKRLVLTDIIIPEQEASAGDVEFKEEDLLPLRTSMTDEEWGKVVGHWHSHCGMGCFWSGTDEDLIRQFSKTRKRSLFIVSSTKEGFSMKTRIVLNEPFYLDIDDVKLEILEDLEEDENYLEEVRKKIRKSTWGASTWEKGYKRNGKGYDKYDDYGYDNYGHYMDRDHDYSGRSGYNALDLGIEPMVFREGLLVTVQNLKKQDKKKLKKKFATLASEKFWSKDFDGFHELEFKCKSDTSAEKYEKEIADFINTEVLNGKRDKSLEEKTEASQIKIVKRPENPANTDPEKTEETKDKKTIQSYVG